MLHLRLTNRMESVFRVSSIVSLTAWLCVGVQQPAVCMRASGRQQECVSPVMNGAEDAEACGRAASRGSPAPRGSPASGQIQKLLREVSRPAAGVSLAFTRKKSATEGRWFLWRPAGRAGWICEGSCGLYLSALLCWSHGCFITPSLSLTVAMSLSTQLFR